MKNKKIDLWRIILFTVAVVVIIFLWVKKDIAQIYATVPKDEILPLAATTIAVSLLKVLGLIVAGLVIKWVIDRRKKK